MIGGESNPCKVCGTPDSQKPMCFRGEEWCSDDHRKVLSGEIVLSPPSPPLRRETPARKVEGEVRRDPEGLGVSLEWNLGPVAPLQEEAGLVDKPVIDDGYGDSDIRSEWIG